MWTWDFSSLRAFGPLQLELWEVCTHNLCKQVLRIQIGNGMDNACFLWRSLLCLHLFPPINSLHENPLHRCKSKHFIQCLLVYWNVLTSRFPTVSILGPSLCLALLELLIFGLQTPFCYFFLFSKASVILQMPPSKNFFCLLPFCMSRLCGVSFPCKEGISVYFLSLSSLKTESSWRDVLTPLISGAGHNAWDMVASNYWMTTKVMRIWIRTCTQTESLSRYICVTWSLEKVYQLLVVVIISKIFLWDELSQLLQFTEMLGVP